TNNGYVNTVDLASGICSNMASGGTRGDFVKVNPLGWVYLTQSSTVEVIRNTLFEPSGPSCRKLVMYAEELQATCGVKLSQSLDELCKQIEDPNQINNVSTINAIDQWRNDLCKQLGNGSLSADCAARARVLWKGLGVLRWQLTGTELPSDPSCGAPKG